MKKVVIGKISKKNAFNFITYCPRRVLVKFGIDIGSVTLVFLKGQTAKTVSPLNINSW